MTIALPLITIPIIWTVGVGIWFKTRDSSGDYNFADAFYFPMAAFLIALGWAIYFALT